MRVIEDVCNTSSNWFLSCMDSSECQQNYIVSLRWCHTIVMASQITVNCFFNGLNSGRTSHSTELAFCEAKRNNGPVLGNGRRPLQSYLWYHHVCIRRSLHSIIAYDRDIKPHLEEAFIGTPFSVYFMSYKNSPACHCLKWYSNQCVVK